MLSFLREQGDEKSSAQKSMNAADQADSSKAEDAQGQEYFVVAAKKENIRKSTMWLAILFGVGLLCLLFMIKKSMPQKASASAKGVEETQIQAAIGRLTGVRSEMFSKMDQIVKKFYEFSNVLQVQVNELVKNPFEMEMFLSNLGTNVESKNDDIEINDELFRQQQIAQIAKDMQLLGIMRSELGNCCMIDDKVLNLGDSIKGFKVTQIGNNFVKLQWQGLDNDSVLQAQPKGLEILLKLSE
jgi:preprotein translocase subunit SecG